MKKIVILIGPPGSGKGTQAKRIAAAFGYGHISTGDLFRALAEDSKADAVEKEALEAMKQGKLVADWLIYRLAFREMDKYLDKGRGVVLDGAIRNLAQAEEFQKYFAEKKLSDEVVAIEVSLTDEESFSRLTKRRVCKKCGEIIPWIPATHDLIVCPKCGGELNVRRDDSEDVIRKRIVDQGNASLKPIADYYRSLGSLKIADGMKTIDEVWQDIQKILNN